MRVDSIAHAMVDINKNNEYKKKIVICYQKYNKLTIYISILKFIIQSLVLLKFNGNN